MAKQRPKGQPLGNIASTLIQQDWNQFNTSTVYMPPGIPPKVQTKGPVRVWDYPAFLNSMQIMTPGVEFTNDPTGLTDTEIREFADDHEITRTVIETCKDQICKLRWTWRLIPKPGQTIEEVKDLTEKDPTVKFLNKFFQSPDKEHTFSQWLRILMEEDLVVDRMVIWKEEDILGRPYALRIIDTALINRCIDEKGVTPSPDLPYPHNIAYQQIIKGQVNEEFTTEDMLYYIRNPRSWGFWGYSRVEQIILTLSTGMRRMAMQLAHYTDGNIPAMFLRAPKEWGIEQIKEFQLYWNTVFTSIPEELVKGWIIPGDLEPVFPQKETLKDEFDEWIARVVCYAFSVSPNTFIKNLNRATSEQAREQADEEGRQTRLTTIIEIMNLIQEKWFGFKDVEFHLIEARPQDSKKQAEIDTLYVKTGVKGVDEIRRELGYPSIGAPPRVYTNNGVIPLTEGDMGRFDVFQQKLLRADEEEDFNTGENENENTEDKPKKLSRKIRTLAKRLNRAYRYRLHVGA